MSRFVKILIIASAFLNGVVANAQFVPKQPEVYESPNGEFILITSPGDRYGGGAGKFILKRRNGTVVWSGRQRFTLESAFVTNRGMVFGYGSESGPATRRNLHSAFLEDPPARARSLPPDLNSPDGFNGMFDDNYNDLFIVSIEQNGRALPLDSFREATAGTSFRRISEGITGFAMDQELDLLTVIRDATGESGACDSVTHQNHYQVIHYSLSTGLRENSYYLCKVLEEDSEVRQILDARAIPVTPLTLVYWEGVDRSDSIVGSYSILDRNGRRVWDYQITSESGKSSRSPGFPYSHPGLIIKNPNPWEFTISLGANREELTCGVWPEPRGAWSVKKLGGVSRTKSQAHRREIDEALELSRATRHIVNIPARPLPPLVLSTELPAAGNFSNDPASLHASRDGMLIIQQFDRVNGARRFVMYDPETGEQTITIPEVQPASANSWAPASGGKCWMIGKKSWTPADPSPVFLVNLRTGKIEKSVPTTLGEFFGIAALDEESFALLGTFLDPPGAVDQMVYYDHGVPAWKKRSSAGFDHPRALCATFDGEIAVLCSGIDNLHFFNRSGGRRAALATEFFRATPEILRPDGSGGLIHYQKESSPSSLRIRRDGLLLSDRTTRNTDGRILRNPLVARPSGELWTSDEFCLYQLTPEQRVQRAVGETPSPATLVSVARAAVGPENQIFVVSAEAGMIHQFNSRGEFMRRFSPEPGELKELNLPLDMTPDSEGGLWIQYQKIEDKDNYQYIHFDGRGARQEIHPSSPNNRKYKYYPIGNTTNYWNIGPDRVEMTSALGSRLRLIERGLDDFWFINILCSATAPDGSLAIIAAADGDSRDLRIHIFSKNGDALQSVPLSGELNLQAGFAFDGAKAAFIYNKEGAPDSVHIMNLADPRELSFPLSNPGATVRGIALPEGGNEVWVFTPAQRVDRYSIVQENK